MTNDYKTGYGKPPKDYQFKKGQSGNPKGRPKGAKNLLTVLEEVLQEPILITEGGQEKCVSRLTALVKSQTAKGIKGETQAANVIFNLICRLREEDEGEDHETPLTEDELAVLQNFEANILQKNATGKKKKRSPERNSTRSKSPRQSGKGKGQKS